MGTIKHNDSRTSLRAKVLIQNARSNEDLGAKTKEQEERERKREGGRQCSRERGSQSLTLCDAYCDSGGVFIGGGFALKG